MQGEAWQWLGLRPALWGCAHGLAARPALSRTHTRTQAPFCLLHPVSPRPTSPFCLASEHLLAAFLGPESRVPGLQRFPGHCYCPLFLEGPQ